MIPHHVYYQLATLGRLWLCIMLHAGWLSRSIMSHQKPTEFVLPHASLRQPLKAGAQPGSTGRIHQS